jgi:hypothetical protein
MPAPAGIHGFFFVATSEVVDAGPEPVPAKAGARHDVDATPAGQSLGYLV